ncbi:uncharacterized protein A4U43_C05F18310 [Asparagus officinalis]|uniref:Uncharacterized protein n=1 Tax=Asparagus officinalis TaxID=4686 RepID=A0A5P1EV24_ASPOF|nr:uncharacterized protein A4U43_C05F18310 [Asparagus officinalis]
MRTYLIGASRDDRRYVWQSDPEHRFEVVHHLNARGTILGSHVSQSRVVEQFYLPRDDEYLKGVPNVGLHLSLQSYLVRGALLEKEIFGVGYLEASPRSLQGREAQVRARGEPKEG